MTIRTSTLTTTKCRDSSRNATEIANKGRNTKWWNKKQKKEEAERQYKAQKEIQSELKRKIEKKKKELKELQKKYMSSKVKNDNLIEIIIMQQK